MKQIMNFISNNINIIQSILPAIITGMAGFVGVKYTYNKNIPLDKLEYTYNEVYYPIYKFINEENNKNNVYLIKNSIEIYFKAYEKYIDFSTIKLYKELCNCTTELKQKKVYKRFYNNIYDMNKYLRKRLGYLEPNIFQLYKYSSKMDKILFCTLYIFVFSYILMCLSAYLFESLSPLAIILFFTSIILFFIWLVLFIIDKYGG